MGKLLKQLASVLARLGTPLKRGVNGSAPGFLGSPALPSHAMITGSRILCQ